MNAKEFSQPSDGWKTYLYFDPKNEKARTASESFTNHPITEANVILVFGGDGTMIKAIHAFHQYDIPFYGINYGHVGFLLNEDLVLPERICVYTLPLLEATWEDVQGWKHKALAVNDAWVERATAQTARMTVYVDDIIRLKTIYADGLLVCTPQGSTAYARAMGGIPLPLNTSALQVVGSNVSFPNWKSALIGVNQTITIEINDRHKRPMAFYVDGIAQHVSTVGRINIYRCKDADIQLAFDINHDLADKIAKVQFPV